MEFIKPDEVVGKSRRVGKWDNEGLVELLRKAVKHMEKEKLSEIYIPAEKVAEYHESKLQGMPEVNYRAAVYRKIRDLIPIVDPGISVHFETITYRDSKGNIKTTKAVKLSKH